MSTSAMYRRSTYGSTNQYGSSSSLAAGSSYTRRPRDSSITRGGNARDSSLNSSSHFRESSLTRGSGYTPPSLHRSNSHRLSMADLTETSKYNRENAVKEIHQQFMRNYKETERKINSDINELMNEVSRSKAYQRIAGTNLAMDVDDRQAKKDLINEMYMEMQKFSGKTVAAIKNLDENGVTRPKKKKEEYTWRKEMEEYEKKAEKAREVKIRNIENDRRLAAHDAGVAIPVSRKTRLAHDQEAAKRADEDLWGSKTKKTADIPEPRRTWRRSTEEEPKPEAPRKSWRERVAEQQANDVKEIKKVVSKPPAPRKAKKEEVETPAAPREVKKEETKEEVETPPEAAVVKEEGKEEDDDFSGVKKMRSDFNSMMGNLEAEMEAGRSKLAKLRERIKRAKGAVKEAGEAIEASKRET